jgi:hypothetical protein
MPHRKPRSASWLAALACAAALPARGELVDDARWLDIHPLLRLSSVLDSNIYLAPGGGVQTVPVRAALVSNLEAAFAGSARMDPRQRIDLNLDLQALSYTADPQVNDALNAAGGVGYRYEGPRGLTLAANLAGLSTDEPAMTEQIHRTHRLAASGGFKVDYGPAGFVAGLEANQILDRYSEPSYAAELDLNETRLGGRLGVRFGDEGQGQLYGIYRRDSIRFTDGRASDSDADVVGMGVQAKLDAKIDAKVEGGVQRTRFAAVELPGQPLDVNSGVLDASLGWALSQRSELRLLVGRNMQISTLAGSRFYFANAAELDASHQFPWGLRSTLGGGLEGDQYTEGAPTAPPRTDLVWRIRASVEYPLGTAAFLGFTLLNRSRISREVAGLNFSDQQGGMYIGYKY